MQVKILTRFNKVFSSMLHLEANSEIYDGQYDRKQGQVESIEAIVAEKTAQAVRTRSEVLAGKT